MNYFQYNKIWNLTILAAGFREGMRPYSMRVGAGARLGMFDLSLKPSSTPASPNCTSDRCIERATAELRSLEYNSSIRAKLPAPTCAGKPGERRI
jgi:hypothetical protein